MRSFFPIKVFMAALIRRRGIMVLVVMAFIVATSFPLSGAFYIDFSTVIIILPLQASETEKSA
jgi:hypothetical protein